MDAVVVNAIVRCDGDDETDLVDSTLIRSTKPLERTLGDTVQNALTRANRDRSEIKKKPTLDGTKIQFAAYAYKKTSYTKDSSFQVHFPSRAECARLSEITIKSLTDRFPGAEAVCIAFYASTEQTNPKEVTKALEAVASSLFDNKPKKTYGGSGAARGLVFDAINAIAAPELYSPETAKLV